NWMDSEDITGSERIEFTHELNYMGDDGNGGSIMRTRLINVTLPGWIEIYARFASFLPFINQDFSAVPPNVIILNRTVNSAAQTWTGDLWITYSNDAGNQSLRVNGIKVDGIVEESHRIALESWLATGELIQFYRDHLHRELLKLIYPTIDLMGLNEVLLELDVDDEFGDLNSKVLEYTLTYKLAGQLYNRELDILFPVWTTLFEELEFYDAFLQSTGLLSVSYANVYYDVEEQFLELDLSFTYATPSGDESLDFTRVRVNGLENQNDIDAFLVQVEQIGAATIGGSFQLKMQKTLEVYEAARNTLHANRPLCEDWLEISGVGVQEVAVCADIDLKPEAEIEKVLATLTFEIEQYFSPEIHFYTLKEMVGKGYTTDEVFEGPALVHGFIEDQELIHANLRTHLYTSDIINILMDIEGVRAVRNVLLTAYDGLGNPVLPSAQWCLEIPENHKPLLDWDHSKFLFFKDNLPFRLDEKGVERFDFYYNQLKAIGARGKLLTDDLDYDIPEGTAFDFKQYSTLRHVFPQTYGIGQAGLSDEQPKARKAKAAQMKGFLLFMDQQLANYFCQLGSIRELFSLKEYHPDEERTYFDQYLTESEIGGNLYVDAIQLQDSLHDLTETEAIYLDRRNRFLDHLLSRFAEDFTDYTLLMHSIDGQKAPRELIHDKISFLSEYDIISKERGKGFNYTHASELWNTDNVSGLEKRIVRKLGIENYERRNLHCPTICDRYEIVTQNMGPGNPQVFRFRLSDLGLLVFDGLETYDSEDLAIEGAEHFLDLASATDNYRITEVVGEFFISVFDPIDNTEYARTTIPISTSDLAERFVEVFRYRITLDFEIETRSDFEIRTQAGRLIFVMRTEDQTYLRGALRVDTNLEVYTIYEEFLRMAANPDNYRTIPRANGNFTIAVQEEPTILARFSTQVAPEGLNQALNELPELFQNIGTACLEIEGIHLIEHILLRPRREALDPFMEVCLEADCSTCGHEDPYSFRASVVFPYWSRRFVDEDLAFREYVENQLRLECPAHVHLKICWVSNKMMRRFELWYRRWLEANAARFHDPIVWSFRLEKLLEAMGDLRSVYPQATLHNCQSDNDANSVILNKTVLGSFNPPDENPTENE
ncbi:MAG: hypothetical protein AAFV80_13610, partial [Bacteroidota bacterium]